MSSKNAAAAQNILGPLIKRLRMEAGLTHRQIADLFTDYGCKCTPARIERIEEQQDPIRDLEIVIFDKIFPGHRFEMIDVIRRHALCGEDAC